MTVIHDLEVVDVDHAEIEQSLVLVVAPRVLRRTKMVDNL